MDEIEKKLKEVDSTQVFFTDLNGRPRSLEVNQALIRGILEHGVGFDGSSVAGIATVDYSDRLLFPVPESLTVVPFEDETLGFFIGKINNEEGHRAACDPRAVLEKILDTAEAEFGYRFRLGPEYEFFLLQGDEFNGDDHTDKAGYFHTKPHDKGEVVRRHIVETLKKCGVRYEKSHHEVTASQHEINLESAPPLLSADRTLLFVHVTQRIAAQHNYHATFMPKPFDGENRNAFHIHLSMQDSDGRNLFYQEEAPYHLSPLACHFIGGVIKYARQVSIIMASTFNSYKAYVLDREAPVIRNWGVRNRSSMVRVPYTAGPEDTRIELRCPDPAGNVYLQMATFMAMGLQGIRERLDCGQPDLGSAYKKHRTLKVWDNRFLPKCMFEALVEAERSRFLKELLGQHMYDNYMALKIADWEEHRTHLTPREHAKYLAT